MKLYYSPGACSLAPHIALAEAGVVVRRGQGRPAQAHHGRRRGLLCDQPQGLRPVPRARRRHATLSEVAVILQYIADRKPGTLAPAFGSFDRYKTMEWLNFIATEVHKQFGPLWYPHHAGGDQAGAEGKARVALRARRQDALGATVPHGPELHHRRRLPLHRPALVGAPQGGPHAVPGARAVSGPHRGASRRAEGPGCRRPAKEAAA